MHQGIYSKNRAEELGYDIWEHFVVPPYFNKLDLYTTKKPKLIIGGRGCGKTMLLRYLCHDTAFSPNRHTIPNDALLHIGLFWRVDTQYAKVLAKRGIDEDNWLIIFEHLATLMISQEVLRSVYSIANSKYPISFDELKRLDFKRLRNFNPNFSNRIEDLKSNLDDQLILFQTWLNNINKSERPLLLPKKFIEVLISEIRNQVPSFKQANFFVYLDEYENLLPEQQRLVNTWVKHSEMPLIFNLAMKRNAFSERHTVGNESLSDIHDFRQYDLEGFYQEANSFDAFAAEILFLPLLLKGVQGIPISIETLRDVSKLPERNSIEYKRLVIGAAEGMFPGFSNRELSVFVLKDIQKQIIDQINAALNLRSSNLERHIFYDKDYPEATIVSIALLHRQSLSLKKILDELDKLKSGQPNKFEGQTGWIHNNLLGCVIMLYAPLNKSCPIYSGFKTFCLMAKGNIRHLLELCHKSISKSDEQQTVKHLSDIQVPPKLQADAAQQASASFVAEVKNFGKSGNTLYTFIIRLGSLLAASHKRPTQSEPEQTHFSITSGNRLPDQYIDDFVTEATKWSVLFEEKSTKQKSKYHTENTDYILNPIYAPFFHISYRKIRKVDLSLNEFECLVKGSLDSYEYLFKSYLKKWSIDRQDHSNSLFSNLNLFD